MSLPFPAIGPILRDRRGHGVDQPARPSAGSPRDILARGALPARHEVGCLPSLLRGRDTRVDVCGQWGKCRTARSCALAKHMRLAEGHRARQRDSRDRL